MSSVKWWKNCSLKPTGINSPLKKIALFLIPLLILPLISDGETHFLKLRATHQPDFLRIVLEGEKSVINRASVYQREQNIIVAFPDTDFSIQTEKIVVAFKKVDGNTVEFYPGNFRGLNIFTMERPYRLVIDVFLEKKMMDQVPERPRREESRETGTTKIRKIVIDPGHGGYDYGLVKDNYIEKIVVLDIARTLRALTNIGSFRSYLTRGSDRLMTQSERAEYSNSKDADIFISLHIGNHSDVVIYVPVITGHVSDDIKPYLNDKGQEEYMKETISLLNAMKEAVIDDLGDDMLSVRPLPYSVLSKTEAAALMIELPSFEDAYYIEEFKTEIANILHKGLYIYEEFKAK
jgi:N-acetylmuramoyl-L-alanine amidase